MNSIKIFISDDVYDEFILMILFNLIKIVHFVFCNFCLHAAKIKDGFSSVHDFPLKLVVL